MRHTFQQCAELAFKKMQYRRFPADPGFKEEVLRLRRVVEMLVDEYWNPALKN